MKWLKVGVISLFVFTSGKMTLARDTVYEGAWHTTNRKLDGIMTCTVSEIGAEKWKGRFYGVWQGVAFDYTVTFTGPSSDLQGTATIDGANYVWRGALEEGDHRRFKGRFGGSRYAGHFDLKERPNRN